MNDQKRNLRIEKLIAAYVAGKLNRSEKSELWNLLELYPHYEKHLKLEVLIRNMADQSVEFSNDSCYIEQTQTPDDPQPTKKGNAKSFWFSIA